MDLKKSITELNISLEHIEDPGVKKAMTQLLNIIEAQAGMIKKLSADNQRLKDENNRFKGEQGKPNIRKQTKPKQDISSEAERKPENNTKHLRQKKKGRIKISRTEICQLDKNQLPVDVIFKGYQSVVVQDIAVRLDNVEFKKAIYYSPSLKKTFIAPTPVGYEGEFGPTIKALVLDLHHNSKMSESAIQRFLENQSVSISEATIARLLTQNQKAFHEEKQAVVEAGLASSVHQQMDDTGARVKGRNHYTHILCNALYTAYFTRPHKDRLTILDILSQGQMSFHFTESAFALMEQMKLPSKRLAELIARNPAKTMNQQEVDALLNELYPNQGKHQTNRRVILEASAISAYQQLPFAIKLLLTDDAPQFKQVTDLLALCWVHDARHYKKLEPVIECHREQLAKFLGRYWDYYRKLLVYKAVPTEALAISLTEEFDGLFATKTGYEQLDERIEKTKLKKESLLLVLTHPTLPLHNNASELGARTQARYRDISYHTMSELGTQAKDTFMTLVETGKKLSVNTYHNFYDRLTKKGDIPSLADLIRSRSQGFAFNATG